MHAPRIFSRASDYPRRLSGALGSPCQLWISPVYPFEHVRHLRRRDRHRAARRRRPDELSAVQSFGVQRQPDAVVPEHLRQIATTASEDIEIAGMGIALQNSPEPAAPAPACRAACRCGRSQSRPGRRSESGSSPRQRLQDARQRRRLDVRPHQDPIALGEHDLHLAA